MINGKEELINLLISKKHKGMNKGRTMKTQRNIERRVFKKLKVSVWK